MADDWHIDPATLTAKGRIFQGTLAPGDLPRVADLVASPEGELAYTITARLDGQRRKIVSCIIKGFASLTCQTTLEPFRYGIEVDDRLVLVDDEAGLPAIEAEGDDEDFMVADGPVDIRDLIEDAVILALPMIPRKPGLEAPNAKSREAEPAKESPFAALRSLKGPDKR